MRARLRVHVPVCLCACVCAYSCAGVCARACVCACACACPYIVMSVYARTRPWGGWGRVDVRVCARNVAVCTHTRIMHIART